MKMYFEALKEILRGSLTIFLFITLPIVVFILITSKTTFLGIQSFTVLSGSMKPAIPLGSIIFIQRAPYYEAGDVIAFKQDSTIITHRVVSEQNIDGKLFYQTKGDANNSEDLRLVAPDQVLGKTVLKAHHIGKLVVFLKTIPGFVTVLVVPTLIYIGFEFWSIKKELEKEIEKKILAKMREDDLDTIPRLSI